MAIGRTGEGNPLKEDAELKHLLLQLDSIDSQREFRRWKVSFLERFEQYLDGNAITMAEERYGRFTLCLGKTSKLVKKLYGFMQKGDMKPPNEETGDHGRVSVLARKCLTDLNFQIEDVIDHLTGMLPATHSEEVELGYSKYHLGAVLIRDGFVEYDRLVICDEILQYMRSQALQLIADRVLLDQMEYYHDRLQMFCDVMADLGLYDAMVKCRQLLYLEETQEDEQSFGEEGQMDQSQSSESEAGYVPPIPLPAIAKEAKPVKPQKRNELLLTAKCNSTKIPKDTQVAINTETPPNTGTVSAHKISKPAPSPLGVAEPPLTPSAPAKDEAKSLKSSSKGNALKNYTAKTTKASTKPSAGLYSRPNDSSDSEDESDGDISSQSSGSKASAVTDTSYFNHQPVWEQEKGQNNQAYYNLNTYYHGNPTDFLIGRKMRNKNKEREDEKKVVTPKVDVKEQKAGHTSSASKEKVRVVSNSKSSKDESRKKSKSEKEQKSKKERNQKVQPIPKAYPPPAPHSQVRSQNNFENHEFDDDADSEEEKKTSFLPATIGGSRHQKNKGRSEDDVEELGMESAHGTAMMSLPKPPGLDRSTRSGVSIDKKGAISDGSKPTKHHRRQRSRNSGTEGVPSWDTVLGPTDRTGRPALHRGMSVVSLHPEENDDADSVLPATSLLAPKSSAFEPQCDSDDDDDNDNDGEKEYHLKNGKEGDGKEEPSVVPLTPSQIKARQKTCHTTPRRGTEASPENEEDSNRTTPTVSSTLENDNANKSPSRNGTKSSAEKETGDEPKRHALKRTDKVKTTELPLKTSSSPPMEIRIPDEYEGKIVQNPSELRAGNHPGNQNLDKAAVHPANHGLRRSAGKNSLLDAPVTEITIGASPARNLLPSKIEDGSKEFSRPRRTASGLKDYSRSKDGDDAAPSRAKSGLKDYSKRGGRTVNISNTPIHPENGLSKDKHTGIENDGKSQGGSDLVRKPKKELKISMSTQESKINVPPIITEPLRSAGKKDKKEKKEPKERKTNKEKRPVPLTEEEKVVMRKKCYMWYARMGQPDRENMKRRVAALPPHCNIYVEDVDLLPWICYGTVLSVKAMNELFMGDDAE